jgi:homoserine kinase type II
MVDSSAVTESSAPSLSMLWETVDPSEALSQRFRFSSPVAVVGWLAGVLDRQWGLRLSSCERLVISSTNLMAWITVDERRMIAKWSMHPPLFPRLAAIAELTGWAAGRGLPVARVLPAADGRRQVELDGFSVGLQEVVAGELLDLSDPLQVVAAGELVAVLHENLAEYPEPIPVQETPRPGTQLVHNDVRSANILWAGGRIAAVLDWDEVRYERRVDDLAKATVLLGTRYHDWGPPPADVRAAFVAAYQSAHPLPPEELGELPGIVDKYLADFGWA